ncbi:MAG: bacillithiol biosynthesis cysteine-adding enzyme BshC [Leptolyngbyaceae cyanobacterium]
MSQIIPLALTKTPRDRYEAWANTYDERTTQFSWSAPAVLLEAVVRYAPPQSFLRVLDIGVGTGQASVPYLEAGACVTGLDVSAAMLHAAKAKHPQFHALIEHDFNLPLAKAGLQAQSFEVVLSCGALHFAQDLTRTLLDLKWVLAPGGVLAFTYIPPQNRQFSSASQLHAPEAVESALQALDFQMLAHQPFTAYYEGGDAEDPVGYQLLVARCQQPQTSLPPALQAIDRTACVDRDRLLTVAAQVPMTGRMSTRWISDRVAIHKANQHLVNALRQQLERNDVIPSDLPLPDITAESARQGDSGCGVLVVMPHPDDESIYAGGTLAAFTEAGQWVRLVVATDGGAGRGGQPGQLAAQRAEELQRAAAILGIEHVESLGLADFGKYRDRARTQPVTAADTLSHWGLDNTLQLLVSKIRSACPQKLLTLHPEVDPNYSLHGHHLGLGVAALVAFHLAADPSFTLPDDPELPAWAVTAHHTLIPPHHRGETVQPIAIDRDRKLQAIQAYRTQRYSTQRLITALQSDNPAANFETLQVLQARGRHTQVTAVALPSQSCPSVPAHERNWQSIYQRVRPRSYPRDALAHLLQQQAATWGTAPPVRANIQKLRDAQTVAVVTGQQVGLLGGPAYTLYKALGAIRLAQQLGHQGIPAVPLFWLASYDHDLAEVQQVEIFAGQSSPATLSLDLPITRRPVGSMLLGKGIHTLLDEVERSLSALPHGAEVMTALRAAYQPGVTFAQGFARWLSYLTRSQGLIILDPAAREFAELARPLLARELFEADNAQIALSRTRNALAAEGKTETIPTDRDVLQLFCVSPDGSRQRLQRLEHGFAMQPSNAYLSREAAQQLLAQQPERFTPSALLRPLWQDAVLPTIAYVAGPTERQYFKQLSQVYTWASLPMPEIVARPSFTLVDTAIAHRLETAGGAVALLRSDEPSTHIGRAGLPIAVRRVCDELQELRCHCLQLRELGQANQPASQAAHRLRQDLERWLYIAERAIAPWGADRPLKAFAHLQAALPRMMAATCSDLQQSGNPGHPPSTRNLTALTRQLARFERTLIREGRQENAAGVTAFTAISPNGAPQERHLNVAELIAIHGTSAISHLLPMALPDSGQTRVVTIQLRN